MLRRHCYFKVLRPIYSAARVEDRFGLRMDCRDITLRSSSSNCFRK